MLYTRPILALAATELRIRQSVIQICLIADTVRNWLKASRI